MAFAVDVSCKPSVDLQSLGAHDPNLSRMVQQENHQRIFLGHVGSKIWDIRYPHCIPIAFIVFPTRINQSIRYVWLPRISERYEVRLNFEIDTRFLMTAEEAEETMGGLGTSGEMVK